MGYIMSFNASGSTRSVGNRVAYELGFLASNYGHQVEQIDLYEYSPFCSGCGYCNTHDGCTIEDDLFPDMAECDGFILTTPIYFCGVSGQAKAWLDRLYSMLDGDMKPRHPGKKVLSIFTQGDPHEDIFRSAVEQTNNVFRMCGWEVVDSVVIPGTALPDWKMPDEIMDRLVAAIEKF